MIKQEDVTIIIPHLGSTKEQKNSLIECLMSLEETFTGPIIVASNGKGLFELDTEGFGLLSQNKGQVTNIHITEQGQCKAVNAAAATVSTPWILVTNDDMIYPPGWFEKLTNTLVDSSLPGTIPACISPKLVEPRKGAPTFVEYFCGGAGGDFDKQKFIEFTKDWHAITEKGFNLPFLISKGLWDMIGGYDINYDPWGSNSDSDLEYKIKLAGIQPYQHQDCLVYHFSQTSGTFEPKNQSYWQKNWDYFIEKWGFPRTDDGIWEATFKIPTILDGRKFQPAWEGAFDHHG